MRIRFFGLAVAIAALVLSTPRSVRAQGLASLAAATSAASATASVEKATTCKLCGQVMGIYTCTTGNDTGWKDCVSTLEQPCRMLLPDCKAGPALAVDADGASQFVSRGSLLGVLASDDSPPRQENCEGVVIARKQSSDDILAVRNRTGTLSL